MEQRSQGSRNEKTGKLKEGLGISTNIFILTFLFVFLQIKGTYVCVDSWAVNYLLIHDISASLVNLHRKCSNGLRNQDCGYATSIVCCWWVLTKTRQLSSNFDGHYLVRCLLYPGLVPVYLLTSLFNYISSSLCLQFFKQATSYMYTVHKWWFLL